MVTLQTADHGRSRRDSRQLNGITPRGLFQPTFATKSANDELIRPVTTFLISVSIYIVATPETRQRFAASDVARSAKDGVSIRNDLCPLKSRTREMNHPEISRIDEKPGQLADGDGPRPNMNRVCRQGSSAQEADNRAVPDLFIIHWLRMRSLSAVCTENSIRVDGVTESPKLVE